MRMKFKDIQSKTDAELAELVQEQREALRDARFSATGAGRHDLKKLRDAKQQIAWSLTELNARRKTAASKQ